MPTLGSTARYTDAAAFADGIHNCRAAFSFHARGAFDARLALARVDDLHMALITETLPRHAFLSYTPDRLFFRFVAVQDRPKTRNGVQDQPGTVIVGPGVPCIEEAIDGPSISRSLSLPMATMLSHADALFDEPPPFLLGRKTPLRPQPEAMARLVALHRDMVRVATSPTEPRPDPQRVAAMQATMWNLLTETLACSTVDRSGQHVQRAQATMRSIVDYIRAHEDRPIALVELCKVAGCSTKSLETLFLRCVGETPNRFLRRWRLWRAREALSAADRAKTTVSEIALACGFWELGRFAVSYRQLFGESPSQTLRGASRPSAEISRRPLTKTA